MARDGLSWQWYVHCPDLKLRTWRYLGPFAAKWQCFGIKRWVWFFLVSTSLQHQGHVLQPQQVLCVLYRRRKIAQATGETRGLRRIRIQTNADFVKHRHCLRSKLPWKNPSDRARSKPHWKIRSSRAWRRKIGASGKNLQLHNVKRSKRTKRRTFWIFWSSRFVWIWCMIFKDLTHSNAPTWGAVGTAVVRFPERLQKKQDSVYHRASLLRYRFQLNEAVHQCNHFFQGYQFVGGFVHLDWIFNFQIFHFNAIFKICKYSLSICDHVTTWSNLWIKSDLKSIIQIFWPTWAHCWGHFSSGSCGFEGPRPSSLSQSDRRESQETFFFSVETRHVGRLDIWDVFWKGASRGFITLWPINYWALTCHTDFFLPFLSL